MALNNVRLTNETTRISPQDFLGWEIPFQAPGGVQDADCLVVTPANAVTIPPATVTRFRQ